MNFQQDECVDRYIIRRFAGATAGGELYDAFQTSLERRVSLLAFNLDVEYRSPAWEYPKLVMRVLCSGHPHLPVLHDAAWVIRHGAPRRVFLLALEHVRAESLYPAMLDRRLPAAVVAQLIHSISALHAAGLAHGSLSWNSWGLGAGGALKIVDFGSLQPIDEDPHKYWPGRAMVEKDVRDLGVLGLRLLSLGGSSVPPILQEILHNATCQGFGGRFPSAGKLWEAIAEAVPAISTRLAPPSSVGGLTRGRIESFIHQFTDAFAVAPPAGRNACGIVRKGRDHESDRSLAVEV